MKERQDPCIKPRSVANCVQKAYGCVGSPGLQTEEEDS